GPGWCAAPVIRPPPTRHQQTTPPRTSCRMRSPWTCLLAIAVLGSGCGGIDDDCVGDGCTPPADNGAQAAGALAAGAGAAADPTGAADYLLDFGTVADNVQVERDFPL